MISSEGPRNILREFSLIFSESRLLCLLREDQLDQRSLGDLLRKTKKISKRRLGNLLRRNIQSSQRGLYDIFRAVDLSECLFLRGVFCFLRELSLVFSGGRLFCFIREDQLTFVRSLSDLLRGSKISSERRLGSSEKFFSIFRKDYLIFSERISLLIEE